MFKALIGFTHTQECGMLQIHLKKLTLLILIILKSCRISLIKFNLRIIDKLKFKKARIINTPTGKNHKFITFPKKQLPAYVVRRQNIYI